MTDYIKVSSYALPNTGSVAAWSNKSYTLNIADYCPSGYKMIAVLPGYPGDDQFVFQETRIISATTFYITIRNASANADSGQPVFYGIYVKD